MTTSKFHDKTKKLAGVFARSLEREFPATREDFQKLIAEAYYAGSMAGIELCIQTLEITKHEADDAFVEDYRSQIKERQLELFPVAGGVK